MTSNRPRHPPEPRTILNDVARGLKEPNELLSEAAKRARQDIVDTPDDTFVAGLEARRTLSNVLRQEDIGRSLHGPDEVIRFPKYLADMFAALGPKEAANLLILSQLTAPELAAVIKLARREVDRTVFHRIWSASWKATLAIAVPTYAVAKWGFEQLPFIKEIIIYIKGHVG